MPWYLIKRLNGERRKSLTQAAHNWKKFVDVGNKFVSSNSSRAIEIKYEELTTNSVPVIKMVCSFLEVGFEKGMFLYHEINKRKNQVPIEHQNFHSNTFKPITSSRVGRWRKILTEDQIRLIQRIQKDTLINNGYEIVRF